MKKALTAILAILVLIALLTRGVGGVDATGDSQPTHTPRPTHTPHNQTATATFQATATFTATLMATLTPTPPIGTLPVTNTPTSIPTATVTPTPVTASVIYLPLVTVADPSVNITLVVQEYRYSRFISLYVELPDNAVLLTHLVCHPADYFVDRWDVFEPGTSDQLFFSGNLQSFHGECTLVVTQIANALVEDNITMEALQEGGTVVLDISFFISHEFGWNLRQDENNRENVKVWDTTSLSYVNGAGLDASYSYDSGSDIWYTAVWDVDHFVVPIKKCNSITEVEINGIVHLIPSDIDTAACPTSTPVGP